MERLKKGVFAAALVVLVICIYSFLLTNDIFKGQFKNDPIGWYFLAKGIFCSLSLYLSVSLLETLKEWKK